MATANREQDYITEARTHARNIWHSMNALLAMQPEWNAGDFGNTLDDGTGDNEGITVAMVGAVVFATANELDLRILQTGFAANLAAVL